MTLALKKVVLFILDVIIKSKGLQVERPFRFVAYIMF